MSQNLPSELYTLASKIHVHFSLDEISQLCFALSIDSEDIEGKTRQEKARGLVLFFYRRAKIQRLLAQIVKERPNVKFTEEFTITTIARELPEERQRELQFLLEELQATYNELIEWKEVHNRLDRLSNQVYGLYMDEVNNLYGQSVTTAIRKQLLNAWDRVAIEIQTFLAWIVDTKFVRQMTPESQSENERGFRHIEVNYKNVLDCIERGTANVASRQNPPFASILRRKNDPKWVLWWLELDDLTRKLGSEIKTQLSRADDKLLQAANELGKQSEKFTGIRGYDRI